MSADGLVVPQNSFVGLRSVYSTVCALLNSTNSQLSSLARFLAYLVSRQSGPTLEQARPALHIRGLGTQWPPNVYDAQKFDHWLREHYDVSHPGIQKLLEVNLKTGIKSRALIAPFGQPLWQTDSAPGIEDVDAIYRQFGVELSVQASRKAVAEWGGEIQSITHVIAVTCTNAGSPGFDQQVNLELGIRDDADRMLLHGVGCAGGLAAMRAAAQMADAASARGVVANVLVYACEVTSIQLCVEMQQTITGSGVSVGPVLFSDGAAAFILSNDLSANMQKTPVYRLLQNVTRRMPDTDNQMSYRMTALGFKLHLSKEVPLLAVGSIIPTFKSLFSKLRNAGYSLGSKDTKTKDTSDAKLSKSPNPEDFDWALHPGGLAVLKGTEMALGLKGDDHLRASHDIYRSRGNSSSVAVLAVLDRLRNMGTGRDNVVACSFGPGLMIEMAALQRCRD